MAVEEKHENGVKPLSDAPSGFGLTLALYLLQKTQFIVTLLTTLALLRIRTAHSLWFGVGTLVAMLSAKFLKLFIRQPRPTGAKKYEKTYGMPSTHSSSIAYFGVYLSLSSLLLPLHPRVTSLLPFWDYISHQAALHTPVVVESALGTNSNHGKWTFISTLAQMSTRIVLAIMWTGGAAAVCWSRVRLGHHTPAQVLAGATLGSTVALIWISIWLGLEGTPVEGSWMAQNVVPYWWMRGLQRDGKRLEGVVEGILVELGRVAREGNWNEVKGKVWELPGVVRAAVGEL